MQFTKQLIRGFLIANWHWILCGVAIVVIVGAIMLSQCGSESPKVEIDENKLTNQKEAATAPDREREANSQGQAANTVANVNEQIRQANANTKAATGGNYSGTTGAELDRKARDY